MIPPAYRFAPAESVFRPAPASTLVPQTSAAGRRPVSVGLIVIVAALALTAQAQLQGAVIAVAALGFPLLLLISWARAGALTALPRWTVGLTAVLAIGIALGWVLLTGDLVVREAGSAFDAGSAGRRVLRDGLGVAEGGAVLMLLPVSGVALLWRSRRDIRDGFVLGALGALVFTAAATLTRLAPQLRTPPLASDQPVPGLLVEAAVRGVAVPMTAACAGALVGAALWSAGESRARASIGVSVCAAAVLAVYALVGRADIDGVPQLLVLSWHVGMAVFALIAVRAGLQWAVRHGVPVSRSAPTAAGRPRPARPLTTWLTAITGVAALFVGLQAVVVRPAPRYDCPPDCGRPPTGAPVSANPRFSPPGGQYSVAYPGPGGDFVVTTDTTGVTARFTAGDGGTMRLTGEPAAGRTAEQVAEDFLAAKVPTARRAYEIPNAKLGFQPGYGVVADVPASGLEPANGRRRVVVIAAVKNDFALIGGGIGPYRQFGPDSGPGRPSPANVAIAEEMGRYVNSFMWASDPPR